MATRKIKEMDELELYGRMLHWSNIRDITYSIIRSWFLLDPLKILPKPADYIWNTENTPQFLDIIKSDDTITVIGNRTYEIPIDYLHETMNYHYNIIRDETELYGVFKSIYYATIAIAGTCLRVPIDKWNTARALIWLNTIDPDPNILIRLVALIELEPRLIKISIDRYLDDVSLMIDTIARA